MPSLVSVPVVGQPCLTSGINIGMQIGINLFWRPVRRENYCQWAHNHTGSTVVLQEKPISLLVLFYPI